MGLARDRVHHAAKAREIFASQRRPSRRTALTVLLGAFTFSGIDALQTWYGITFYHLIEKSPLLSWMIAHLGLLGYLLWVPFEGSMIFSILMLGITLSLNLPRLKR